jgi:hypothetical protein
MELHEQTQANLNILIEIRDNPETTPGVRIQAIQAIQKIVDNAGAAATPGRPTEDQIMEMIRKNKAKK